LSGSPSEAARARLAPYALGADPLATAEALVIGTLLEEGSSAELAWLTDRVGEAALGEWLTRRGGRQLSRRSRAFWELVLGRAAGPPSPPLAAELWPL